MNPKFPLLAELIAEFLGTFVLILLGTGVVAMVVSKWMKRRQPMVARAAAGSMSNEQFDEFRRRARQETEV